MPQFAFEALPLALVFAQPLLGLLQSIDVCRRTEPPAPPLGSVWKRVDPAQKPAEHAVMPAKARLKLASFSCRHHRQPVLDRVRQVVGMHGGLPAPASGVL